tara:strand:- start:10180 stop:12201 length:2022 start_codon:yes stop_codon:yes gene_type:complete
MPHHNKEPYEAALKRRVIEDYIKQHKRSPSRAAIFELEREYRKKYKNLDEVGFSAVDLKTPGFIQNSSASIENTNRRAIKDDLSVVEERIVDLIELMDDSFRGYSATANRCNRLVKGIESRLNNLILLNSGADIFLYGIEETFDTHNFVDQENTTASVEPGYVTLGRDNMNVPAIDATNLEFYASADRGFISARPNSSIESIKKADGTIWEYYVYTSYKSGRVSLVIEADFDEDEGRYIGEVRLTGNAIDNNGRSSWTVLYSIDGQTYAIADSSEQVFNSGINSVSLGLEGVKKIQIMLTKTAADDISVSGGKNAYIFSIDHLEITSDKFSRNSTSTLYCGPYEVYDEFNEPVNFSLATMETGTCCILPDKTSVSFFLSKDNINWIPASYTGDSFQIVQFHTTNPIQSLSYIDEGINIDKLVSTPPVGVDLEYSKEALCNMYISSAWSDKFVLRNTYVERNLPQGNISLYGVNSGWFYDAGNQQYNTTIHIDNIEGRVINLGTNSAYINGKLVSGQISLPKGYHKFSTSHTNWYDVEKNVMDADDLREKDPLYPYNHKLIVEGYDYPDEFSGDKVYNGIGRYFGSLLRYVTPERFNHVEFDEDLSIYTIEDYYGNLYFKVKTTPSDSSWQSELFNVKYMLRMDEVNTMYVKAILRSNDSTTTPHINSFQIRVV